MEIPTLHERKRGCGFRKPGGLYLRSGNDGVPCCKLPIPLEVCPVCHSGIKAARGWTWIDLMPFVKDRACESYPEGVCPLSVERLKDIGKVGLVWIGEKFYPRPKDVIEEATEMGFSRRIPHLPKGFVVGETWVALAHRNCTPTAPLFDGRTDREFLPGIFRVFKPERVEYVVRDDPEIETPEFFERLTKRGITPVRVVPVEDEEPPEHP